MWFDIIKTRFRRLWRNKHTQAVARKIKTTNIDGVITHILRDIHPRGNIPGWGGNPKEPVYSEQTVTEEQLKEHWEEITS